MSQRQGPLWDFIEGRIPGPPVSQHLGWKCREIDPEGGTIVVDFVARPEFLNPVGSVQGGLVAAMLDDTMAPLIHATLEPGQGAPTLELKVSFLRPAQAGPLVGRGRLVHRGSSVAFLEAQLEDPEGMLLATASATVCILKGKPRQLDLGRAEPGAGESG